VSLCWAYCFGTGDAAGRQGDPMNQKKASTKTIAVTQCLSRPADMVWPDEAADAGVRDGLLGLLRTAIGGMGALVAAA